MGLRGLYAVPRLNWWWSFSPPRQAAAGGGHTDVQSRSSAFRALGSTSAVDARDNTATTHTAADRGVPIYWLNGPKGADDYADFYDGSWDHRNPIRNEHGNARLLPSFFSIWTGSNSDGTRSSNNSYLGSTSPRVGRPGSGAGHEISSDRINPRSNVALYGLSGVFRVEGVAAVDNADLSDLRVDGTSVDGFAAATISYTVGVANPVERVAIAASTSDPGAGLAYSPADADSGTDGHQVNLAVGANTVTVTAASTSPGAAWNPWPGLRPGPAAGCRTPCRRPCAGRSR